MDKRFEIALLLDFYSELLTNKQRDIMDLYFNKDLSLSEIAENNDISRQAIHDIIKRCEKILMDYESKLHLLEKQNHINDIKKDIIEKCNLLHINDSNIDNIVKEIVEDLEKIQ